jgi:hypothetical protein
MVRTVVERTNESISINPNQITTRTTDGRRTGLDRAKTKFLWVAR